ncbi:MAG: ribosome-binding factor A [Chitinophagales bacterium]|jgi:ribosome-binding factor A|nr:ribosome-binding factor A [Chitinophagales bacterium]
MDSRRQQKIANLIQEEAAKLMSTDLKPFFMGYFTTLTKVNVTPDLSIARMNLSVFNAPDKQALIDSLNENAKEIRKILGHHLKHSLRIIPEFKFYLDDNLDYIDKIESLLKE